MRLFLAAPDIFSNDAVGSHCFGISRLAERLDIECQLYASGFRAGSRNVKPIEALFHDIRPNDTLLLSHSIFDPNFDRLLELSCHKICYYHGVTSPQLLADASPELSDLCRRGLEQTEKFGSFDLIVTNSEHTLLSLPKDIVTKKTRVVPPIFPDMPIFQHQVLPTHRLASDKVRFLSVGRVVPHKRIEDAVTLLHGTHKQGVDAHLTIVGALVNSDYFKCIIQYARECDVLEHMEFTGMLADCDLFRTYESSDILIVTSSDEGFCVPVIEAQAFACGTLVRKGTAAEYLVEPEEAFEMKNGDYPPTFFQTFQNLRQKQSDYAWQARNARRVKNVLAQCSDLVWQEILMSSRLKN